MENRYSRFLMPVIALILSGAGMMVKDPGWSGNLFAAALGVVVSFLISTLGWGLENRKKIWTVIKAHFIWNLRISCSYLYRIKVGDHYLLIKSRKHGKFQPVGGNFKRNRYSHDGLRKLEIKEDNKFSSVKHDDDDLRVFVRGYKLPLFLKWYNSPNKKREVCYDREFYEELIKPGFLPSKTFGYPVIDFIKQVITPVRYSKYLQCFEVHIYDIVELNPNREQLEALKELKYKGDSDILKWCKAETIRCQGYKSEKQTSDFEITDHSVEIIN
tara:strand:- start:16666 stop:17481 length:816 start_codon:yes stop_codon:yes gene_type:complete